MRVHRAYTISLDTEGAEMMQPWLMNKIYMMHYHDSFLMMDEWSV